MIDTEKVRNLMDIRGIRWAELSDYLHIQHGHLRRSFNSQDILSWPIKRIEHLADFFHLPLQAVLYDKGNARWIPIHWSETKELANYHDCLKHAKRCLTITNGMESYLQRPDMVEWTGKIWLATPDWDKRLIETNIYVDQQRVAREEGRFRHRIIGPAQLFMHPIIFEKGWNKSFINQLSHYDCESSIGVVDDWGRFKSFLRGLLPQHFTQWDKITIVDNAIILIRDGRSNSRYYLSYDRRLIDSILNEIDAAAGKYLPDTFPTFDQKKVSQLRASKKQFTDFLSLAELNCSRQLQIQRVTRCQK